MTAPGPQDDSRIHQHLSRFLDCEGLRVLEEQLDECLMVRTTFKRDGAITVTTVDSSKDDVNWVVTGFRSEAEARSFVLFDDFDPGIGNDAVDLGGMTHLQWARPTSFICSGLGPID